MNEEINKVFLGFDVRFVASHSRNRSSGRSFNKLTFWGNFAMTPVQSTGIHLQGLDLRKVKTITPKLNLDEYMKVVSIE